jgi:hypothetical protein
VLLLDHGGSPLAKQSAHPFLPGAHNDNRGQVGDRLRRLEDVQNHRLPAHAMQHLLRLRIHAGAVARCQKYGGNSHRES